MADATLDSRWNHRAAAVAAAILAVEAGLFLWATGALRGWFGDLLVVILQVALLASAGIGTPSGRLRGIAILSIGAELLQGLHLVGPQSHWILHALLGSTLDPWDLVAYALGLWIAVPLERWWAPRL